MKENAKEITCVKCGTTMKRGYLVERDPSEIIPAGLGFYWIPMRGVLGVFKTVALIAYACPECGYIEQYIKNIEQDRERLN
jgi:predicted nucleic-acid-binding Zn-ribbon protein